MSWKVAERELKIDPERIKCIPFKIFLLFRRTKPVFVWNTFSYIFIILGNKNNADVLVGLNYHMKTFSVFSRTICVLSSFVSRFYWRQCRWQWTIAYHAGRPKYAQTTLIYSSIRLPSKFPQKSSVVLVKCRRMFDSLCNAIEVQLRNKKNFTFTSEQFCVPFSMCLVHSCE